MDSYREPNVRIEVIEEGFSFAGPVTGLPPIIFGPLFQIEVKAAFGTYDGTELEAGYPDLKTDAEVDEDTVEMHIIHTDTGYEYDVEDLESGTMTITDSLVTVPADLYSMEISSVTGRRDGAIDSDAITIVETFSDSAVDFSDVEYNDELVITDEGDDANNTYPIDTTDGIGAIRLQPGEEITPASILYYDTLAGGNFEAGNEIEGAGGATAPILFVWEDPNAVLEGYLLIGEVAGAFVDAEVLTENDADGATGVTAAANGISAQANTDSILYYDDLTVDFAIGEIVSGAVGIGTILYQSAVAPDTYGFFLLGTVTEGFVDDEAITGDVAGVAVANGTDALIDIVVNREYEIRRPISGEAYITYKACRADLDESIYYCTKYSDVLELADDNEDAMVAENPLAYAGKLCTDMNSECFLVPVQDLEGYNDPDDSTNASAWADAFALARDYETPYSYVVLSQNDVVRSYLEVAVNWKRDPDNYMNEVVAYFCPQRVTEDVAITTRVTATPPPDSTHWKDANISDFTAYGCLAGRTLELIDVDGVAGDEGVVYEFTVTVVDSDELTLEEEMSALEQTIETYRYVNEYYDADAEALALGIYGQAIENKAMRLIYPARIQMDNTEVPGYYLGVIRAAQMNINRPATIYTGSLVPVVERVLTTFTRTQLNVIASGGIMVFYHMNTDISSGASSPIKCRDAITTDRTNAAREEEVVVTEVDYSSRYIRGVFLPEMGKRHNDEMLDDGIATLVGGCQSHLVDEIKCVSSLKLESYEIDEDEVRKINYEWSLEPRYPNKWADMVIHVVT